MIRENAARPLKGKEGRIICKVWAFQNGGSRDNGDRQTEKIRKRGNKENGREREKR